MTVKFNFNCIIIDKSGVHNVDLSSDDPFAKIEAEDAEKAAAEEQLSTSATQTPAVAAAA